MLIPKLSLASLFYADKTTDGSLIHDYLNNNNLKIFIHNLHISILKLSPLIILYEGPVRGLSIHNRQKASDDLP